MSFFNLMKTNDHWHLTTLHEAGNINIVFAPSEYLHMMPINLPLSAKNQIQKAIPYAVESNLAQPIEALHLVIGEQDKEGNINICLVDKSLMRIWRDICQQAGYHNAIMLPDIFMLPYQPKACSILKTDSRYVIRTGQQQGFALFQLEHLPLILQEEPVAIDKIISYDMDGHSLTYLVENRHFDKDMLTQLNFTALKAFDLLQGEFALEKKHLSTTPQWKRAAYLGLAIFTVWGLGSGIKIYTLSKQQGELDRQIITAYQHYFPNSTEIIDPELRLKNISQHYKAYDPRYLNILLALQAVLKPQQAVQLKDIEYTKDKMLLTFNEIQDDFFISLEQQLQGREKIKRQDKQHILIEWSS